MELHSAVEAVVLVARRAVEVGLLLPLVLVEDESVLAVSGGAPREVLLHVNGLIERKVGILLVLLSVKQVLEVDIADLPLALGIRAVDREAAVLDLSPQILTEAVLVEDMLAELERED